MVDSFRKRTAWRIALVSMVLAAIASPISWMIALASAEKGAASLAMEAPLHAQAAARTIAGGLFDIA